MDPDHPDKKEDIHNIIDYEHIRNTDWSSQFSINDFEDFQISFKSDKEGSGTPLREITEIDQLTGEETLIRQNTRIAKWHEP